MAGINVPVGIKNAQFKSGLDEMRGQARKFAGDVKGEFVGSFSNIKSTIAGAFGVGAIVAFTKSVIDFGGQLKDSADRLNLNVESLQGLGYAFSQSGATQEDFEKGMVKLNQNLDAARGGSETMIASFEKLGITWADIAMKKPEEILMLIANGMRDAKDPTEALAAALDILGKSGMKMVPGLRAGADELKRLRDEASKLDEESVAALDNAGDAMTRLGNKFKVGGAYAVLGLRAIWNAAKNMPMTGQPGAVALEENLPQARGYGWKDMDPAAPEDPRAKEVRQKKEAEAIKAEERGSELSRNMANLGVKFQQERMEEGEALEKNMIAQVFKFREEQEKAAGEKAAKAKREQEEKDRDAKEAAQNDLRAKEKAKKEAAEKKDALPGIARVSADSLQAIGGGGGIGGATDPQVRELQNANNTLRLILNSLDTNRRGPAAAPPVK